MTMDKNDEHLKKYYDFFDQNHQDEKTIKPVEVDKVIYEKNLTIEEAEEQQKRGLRVKLINLVSKLVWVQLFFFNFVVLFVLSSIILNIKCFKIISNIDSQLLIDFLKYYMSVTIVELLGMLLFIIQFAFTKHSKAKK